MASEYTNYFNLDLYTDSDKPNLRDQYNGAMQKVDEQMHTNAVNITAATNIANTAQQDANTNKAAISDMDAAYKAADTALSDRITTNANSITANTTAISDMDAAYKAADTALSDRITTNANSISDMDTQIKTLQQSATASSLNPFKGRKLFTIGDSWLEGYSSIGSTTPWGDTLRTLAGIDIADYKAFYKGGTGFVNTVSSTNFQTLASDAAAEIGDDDKVTVCIVGGINDRGATYSAAYNGAYSVVNTLKKKGDTEVYVFPMALVGRHLNAGAMEIKNAITSGATAAGAVVFSDCYDWLYDTDNWHADELHPNTAGQTAFANFMYASMRGSVVDMHAANITMTGANGVAVANGSYIRRNGTNCVAYFAITSSVSDGIPFCSFSKGYSPGGLFGSYTNPAGELKTMNLKDVDSTHVGFAPSYGNATGIYTTMAWAINDD